MAANFTSVVLENGLLPIAQSIQKQLGLSPGDQVRISIKVLNRYDKRGSSAKRYDELLAEKEMRVLTPAERTELIALANAEFDVAISRSRTMVQKSNPELFDEVGRLKRRKALASLGTANRKKGGRKVRANRKTMNQ